MPYQRFRYLAVTRRDQQSWLYVAGAGYDFGVPNDDNNSCWLDHPTPFYYRWSEGRRIDCLYAVHFNVRETIEFESEHAGQAIAKPGSLIFLFPGQWHRQRGFLGHAVNQYWVWFGGEYGQHLIEKCGVTPSKPVLMVGPSVALQVSYQSLVNRLESESLGYRELAAANVVEILGVAATLAQEQRRQQEAEPSKTLIHDAEEVMKSRLDQPLNLSQLTHCLGLDYNYFRVVFRNQTGLSPYQYHLRLRLERAKELLRATPLSLKDIAWALGFCDEPSFSKVFTKHVGVRPGRWREKDKMTEPR
jgi:AraC-like DNA-binding protein